ncbi:RNA polymerase sigma factor region1.1 domain-containing protein [Romboutsia sp. 1001216sp1]|uniref:RNA polymerase sigma factor region1.1 domain-containing protein n=1 Tax=Romboutsia sp. 1001216sp1 TaxID=2986997 RepID=UPI00232C75B9|nr:RNA polymerase sigma factor region1.1 domain-containing protein [Romboutsia sp. 1001216sp1]MDB8804791.1 RNA polymerase sigma factor region1.1 domain-containing protein [Romboutsia sp. 1001216sp1]MDB8808106.1 RNA polymerase sigma factor region1.1 domain-containing protein [Romboutsia sp. 1001216sp1]MDB8810437.1 RNA polymerase sigma factor region1.1 domain-containing protein [Romboutsia sp. 1001216sp1]MDB8816156.1 RNA polymerase sigma factor region1.1 domain-containing protein [Romboutsia sp. 
MNEKLKQEVMDEFINLFKELDKGEMKKVIEFIEKLMVGELADLIEKGKKEGILTKVEILNAFKKANLNEVQMNYLYNRIVDLGITISE